MNSIKRPPSYSDSYLVLGDGLVTPLDLASYTPRPPTNEDIIGFEQSPTPQPSVWPRRIGIFLLKSSFHVFLISVFETVFFFTYVSVTENAGILKTIDTYYEPVVQSCPGWGNLTKWFLEELFLYEVNVSLIDSQAEEALAGRESFNHRLLLESLGVSGGCLGLFVFVVLVLKGLKVKIPWSGILVENTFMVSLLGLYEYFFFRRIIYNYDTLSTQELNAHIVDGLWKCVGAG